MIEIQAARAMLAKESRAGERRAERIARTELSELIEEGEVLGPLLAIEPTAHGLDPKRSWLQGAGFYCKFRKGDGIDLHVRAGRDATEASANGLEIHEVRYPSRGQVLLAVTRKQKAEQRPQPDVEYFVFPSHDSGMDARPHGFLKKAMDVPRPAGGQLLLHWPADADRFLEALNNGQRDALWSLCEDANQRRGHPHPEPLPLPGWRIPPRRPRSLPGGLRRTPVRRVPRLVWWPRRGGAEVGLCRIQEEPACSG